MIALMQLVISNALANIEMKNTEAKRLRLNFWIELVAQLEKVIMHFRHKSMQSIK
jgi:hypothetical protein